ncbi:MAG TPA: MFS transporter [Marmoricola sp.]|nr:MFS transporter [Marmoricola sp.]
MTAGARITPLKDRNFRVFYLGELVNTAGSSMATVSLAFAVLAIKDSPSALGWVAAASTAPMVAFMLLGGAVADRLPRALVLRGCNLVQAVVQGLTATLVLTHCAHIWQLVALQLVSGTAFAVSYPAIHGMVPILLRPEQRKAAYLLINQTESALRIVGPATAGVLVATVGPGWALGFDAVTYVVAALFLAVLRLPFGARPERQDSVIGDFKVGWRFVRRLGWVLPVASGSLVFNALISGAIMVLGPAIAHGTIGSDGWGFARSGQAVGLFAATLVLSRVTLSRPLLVCVVAFVLCATPMLVLGTWVDTIALTAAFVVAGAASSVIGLAWSLTVQEKVPEEMLSRVMAIDGFFSFVAMPVGEVLVGPFAHAFGARGVELGSVAICVVVGVVAATRPVIRDLRLTGPATAGPGG